MTGIITARPFVPGCYHMMDGEEIVGRAVNHPAGGWMIVDLEGKPLSTLNFETPELAARYFPAKGLP